MLYFHCPGCGGGIWVLETSADEVVRCPYDGSAQTVPGYREKPIVSTEADWLTWANPDDLLRSRGKRLSSRKLRFYAVASCQRAWDLLTDQRSRDAVGTSERYADGRATGPELASARTTSEEVARARLEDVYRRGDSAAWVAREAWAVDAAWAAHSTTLNNPWLGAFYTGRQVRSAAEARLWKDQGSRADARLAPSAAEARRLEEKAQSALFREIVGNPFRWATIDPFWPSWNHGTVLGLAQMIYRERAFDNMPILADALQDAGCVNPAVLSHCRGPGPHVRGCWVVDLILGKY